MTRLYSAQAEIEAPIVNRDTADATAVLPMDAANGRRRFSIKQLLTRWKGGVAGYWAGAGGDKDSFIYRGEDADIVPFNDGTNDQFANGCLIINTGTTPEQRVKANGNTGFCTIIGDGVDVSNKANATYIGVRTDNTAATLEFDSLQIGTDVKAGNKGVAIGTRLSAAGANAHLFGADITTTHGSVLTFGATPKVPNSAVMPCSNPAIAQPVMINNSVEVPAGTGNITLTIFDGGDSTSRGWLTGDLYLMLSHRDQGEGATEWLAAKYTIVIEDTGVSPLVIKAGMTPTLVGTTTAEKGAGGLIVATDLNLVAGTLGRLNINVPQRTGVDRICSVNFIGTYNTRPAT